MNDRSFLSGTLTGEYHYAAQSSFGAESSSWCAVYKLVRILLLSLLAVVPVSTVAAETACAIRGTIISSQDTAGTLGRGQGRGVLDGFGVEVRIAVDPVRAPADASVSPDIGRYASRVANEAWLRLDAVEIAGQALELRRFEGSVTRHDAEQRLLVTAAGYVHVFVDIDWEDESTGAFLDEALRIGLDGPERTSDVPVPFLGPATPVEGSGSFSLLRIAPGGALEAYVGFDFRIAEGQVVTPDTVAGASRREGNAPRCVSGVKSLTPSWGGAGRREAARRTLDRRGCPPPADRFGTAPGSHPEIGRCR